VENFLATVEIFFFIKRWLEGVKEKMGTIMDLQSG
jgi:hypothetical protein